MTNTIVAVTDERTKRAVTRALGSDHSIRMVEGPEETLRAATAATTELVILDLEMPNLSGADLLRRLGRDMPVILLMSKVPRGGFSSVLRGLSEGFDRPSQLVLKPIDPEALRNRVSHVLELLPGRRRQKIRVLLPELHDTPSGRIDAAKIAAYLDVPLKQLAPALRASYQAIHKTPDSPAAQAGLVPIKRSLELLRSAFADDSTVRAWLNSAHPALGDRTPLSVLLEEGGGDAVRTLLDNALEGLPS
jgi:CheY-like chemotaxis protein